MGVGSLPNPVEDLGGGIHGNAVADGLEEETQSHEDDHAGKSLWTTPDIDDFGEDDLEETGDEVGGDGGGRGKAVGVKGGGDPWAEKTGGTLLHGIDEVDDEDPGEESVNVFSWNQCSAEQLTSSMQ